MKLIGPFSQIVTMQGLPERGALNDSQLHIIDHGGIVVNNGVIVDVGDYASLLKSHSSITLERVEGTHVLLPGFIDAHTHICWAGSRSTDFALRNAGKSYLEIAETGGGIWSTVVKTRNASIDDLAQLTVQRADIHLRRGVTTIEVKSGYGLNTESELAMLESINKAREMTKADLIPTCLAAHMKPRDFSGDESSYLKLILSDLMPKIKSNGLACRFDIFVEKSAFSIDESFEFLKHVKSNGFNITVHADQFTPGGSLLAVQIGAISADHLEASTDHEINALSASETVAVALPGASLGLGEPMAPVRKLLDKGAIVAIASDWNPGSAPMGDLLTQASILATYQKVTTAEVFSGLTFRAAHALGLTDRGKIQPKMLADLQSYATDDYRDILYYQGQLKPVAVWKNGTLIS